jgi:GDP-4-dehydro-6-deoxy-D-mannose reductase
MTDIGTILITGAEGFVGRSLASRMALAFPGAVIAGTCRSGDPVAEVTQTVPLDLTTGDIGAVVAALKPDLIVHLAARSSVAQSLGAGDVTFYDNVEASLRLADALRRHAPGKPLIFASSGEVYGASFNRQCPVDEATAPQPQNPYARSKLAGEFAFADMLSGVSPVMALRLFNHFGPAQDTRFVVAAFAAQIRAIRAGTMPPVIKVGNLDAVRDFLPLEDVLEAYVAAARVMQNATPGFGLFNIASGHGRRIASILDDLIAVSGVSARVEIDPARLRPSEIPTAIGDARAFRAATDWAPSTPWDLALKGML